MEGGIREQGHFPASVLSVFPPYNYVRKYSQYGNGTCEEKAQTTHQTCQRMENIHDIYHVSSFSSTLVNIQQTVSSLLLGG